MSGDDLWFERSGDEFDDHEFPEEDDFDDDRSETVPCPECGAEVYEDAPQCPHCGTYVTHDTNIWSGRPAWWIALGLLGILAVVLALSAYIAW